MSIFYLWLTWKIISNVEYSAHIAGGFFIPAGPQGKPNLEYNLK